MIASLGLSALASAPLALPSPPLVTVPSPAPRNGLVPGPGTAPLPSNPIAAAIESARQAYEGAGITVGAGDYVPVLLPPTQSVGISIQAHQSWTPLAEVYPWWGDATLVLIGHPAGTTILPVHDEVGWGESLAVRPHDAWDGRVWFIGLTVYASGDNAVDLGFWGQDEHRPLRDVRFYDCRFLDHPDPSIRCVRPVSANQAAIFFAGCVWNLPNSREHAVYSRNPVGDSGMIGCHVKAVGGQVWQEVNRPSEGPDYSDGGRTILSNSLFENYHRDDSMSGSAITVAGSGREFWLVRSILLDVERPNGEASHGGFVAWDGGEYYTADGVAIDEGDDPLPGQYANGLVRVEQNIIVHKDPDRSILKIDSSPFAIVRGNGFYGPRPVEIHSQVDGDGDWLDAGVGGAVWVGNNQPWMAGIAALLVPADLLVEPDLHYQDETVGPASTTFSF